MKRAHARHAHALTGILLGIAGIPTTHAQPNLLTFEDIPGMVNASGTTVPAQSRLRDQYLASHGVRFSSGSAFVAVVTHGANTPSGTRIIGGTNAAGQLTYQSAFPLVAEFFDAGGATPYVVSVVTVRGDLQPIPGTKTLEAYDANGALLDTDTQQDSNTAPLRVEAPGIHRVRMFSSSATVGFDDLRFDDPVPASTSCPADLDNDGSLANGGTPDGAVTIDDLLFMLAAFEAGDLAGDVDNDGDPAVGSPDGAVDINDLVFFLQRFEQGC